MDPLERGRRFFFFTLGGLAISPLLARSVAAAQAGAPGGFVLGPGDGEHLVHFRDGGDIFIKVGAAVESSGLAVGTQQVKVGTGIPLHRHFKMDEAFYVLEGRGHVVLNDVRHAIAPGGTVFISKNTWHAFENPDHELLLLWMVSPAGLDGFFRDTCSPPGVPAKALTPGQIREIALKKYDTEFR